MVSHVLQLCLTTASLLLCYTNFVLHVSCHDENVSRYVQVVDDDIIKPPNDQSQYRYVQLTNEMKVLLISNQNVNRSSVSLNINVGYINSPKHNPYLAEMLQRTLSSLVAENSEDEEKKIFWELSYTINIEADRMTFTFDFLTAYLPEFLQRLAKILSVPQLSLDLVRTTVEEINEDLKLDINDPYVQRVAILRSLSNRSHDFYAPLTPATLQTVNATSSAKYLKEMVNFHEQHFSANLMTLVVTGNASIDELMNTIVPLFAPVPNKRLKIPMWTNHPFGPQQTGYYFNVETQKNYVEDKEFVMLFPVPDFSAYFRSKPWLYVTRLLSRKGEKSFLANQRMIALIDSESFFESKIVKVANGFGFLRIACHLTDKGRENVPEVVQLFIDYINFLKTENVQQWIHDEIQAELQIDFNLQTRRKHGFTYTAADMVSALSNPLIPPKYCVYEKYAMDKYNPELIQKFMSYLTVDNLNVFVWSKTVHDKSGQLMKWFDKQCYVKKLDEILVFDFQSTIRITSTNFSFPKPNLYLPSNLDIVKTDDSENFATPRIIFESGRGRIWYLKDNLFKLPRLRAYFKLISPVASNSVASRAVATLYGNLMKSSFSDYSDELFDEKSVEMSIDFGQVYSGYVIKFSGYSDQMLSFIEYMFHRMLAMEISQSLFVQTKQSLMKELENERKELSASVIDSYSDILLSSKEVAPSELLHHVKDISMENLIQFKSEFFSTLFTELFVYGNADKQGAKEIFNSVQRIIKENFGTGSPVDLKEIEKPRTVVLPEGKHYLFVTTSDGSDNNKSAIKQIFQTGPVDIIRNNALNFFVAKLIRQYARRNSNSRITVNHKREGVNSIEMFCTDRRKPEDLVSQIESLIRETEKWVVTMPNRKLEFYKTIFTDRPERTSNAYRVARAYWKEIENDEYFFNRSQAIGETVRNVTKSEIITFIKENLGVNSPKRSVLSIYAYPKNQAAIMKKGTGMWLAENVTLIHDILAFKKSLPLSNLPKPVRERQTIRNIEWKIFG